MSNYQFIKCRKFRYKETKYKNIKFFNSQKKVIQTIIIEQQTILQKNYKKSQQIISQQRFLIQIKRKNKMKNTILIISLLICISYTSYIPQLILTTTSQFLNKQLNVNAGPLVDKFINDYNASDVTFNDTFGGFHIQMNMTNIKQKVSTNWNANILNVTGTRNFSILAKNINITIDAHISFYVAAKALKQKGNITIEIQQLEADTFHSFVRSPTSCPKTIGFNLFVNDIQIDSNKFVIDFKKHPFDDLLIRLLINLLRTRLPNIINGKVRDTLNNKINDFTCTGALQQVVPVGQQSYVLSINTTDVPYFANNKILTLPIDINFQNQRTNQTNQEVDNENLFQQHVYEDKANATLTLSSNMLDTVMWLVDDSQILSAAVTKDQLGPNPPINLDTSGLAILLPGLKKYPNKDVIVRVNTSSQFSQIFIRSGRFLSGLSISADFIINNTGRVQDLKKCLQLQQCFVATSLNITIGLSASVRATKINYWSGLLQSIYIAQIQVIDSKIDVNVQNLKKILNSLILSSRPSINKQLQDGIEFSPASIQKLKKLNLTGLIGQSFLDYASFGLVFEL